VSEPKRYDWKVNEENDFDLIEHPNGEYIRYADYARLKAEVERLRDGVETMTWNASGVVTTQWVRAVEYDRLKAEVERLTKAGDALHAFLIDYIVESRISSAYLNKLDDGWNAAKEGKQP
jgi:hypothetical protein